MEQYHCFTVDAYRRPVQLLLIGESTARCAGSSFSPEKDDTESVQKVLSVANLRRCFRYGRRHWLSACGRAAFKTVCSVGLRKSRA
ncbi:hypothetical protein KIN20_031495 [Parelaphostrongylus tenuis]|uniref:Uncharacterized protein n=1 Tax=Parelaphostrongylus tenuis TaxID=148309 RepID=A0AAD5WH98_PARTN|nr:hypothetical protein KIN20_031495 [Parelaphostrongylus tenuis]